MADSVCVIYENRSFGGMEVHTVGLIEALLARDVAVEIIINGTDTLGPVLARKNLDSRVSIVRTDLGGILTQPPDAAARWRQQLQQVRADTVIFPKGVFASGQLPFLNECRRRFKRVVFIEHLEAPAWKAIAPRRWLGIFPGLGLWRFRERHYRQKCAQCADVIVTVSDGVRKRLVEDWRQPGSKIVVVRNGVAWPNYRRDEAVAAKFREHHGIPADAFIFGMLVRLSTQKSVDVAIRAMHKLSQEKPSSTSRLVIAGEGAEEASLRALTHELGLESRVHFVGFVSEPKAVLSAFDVILFSSANEGLPLALLEGMATGCVPIVTRIGGMPEVVNSSSVGWVVPAGDPQSLSAAMRAVLELDPAALAAMRNTALGRIREAFDSAACYERIFDLCELRARSTDAANSSQAASHE